MSDEWAFYYAQLAGASPETTPGRPHAGYYRSRRRETFVNPNPTVGGPRKKVRTEYDAVAIWHADGEWHCLVTKPNGEWRHMTDTAAIDQLFAFVCRDALTYADYLKMTVHPEQEDAA